MGESDGLGWRAALPPDQQNHEALTPFKEVKDLGAGYLDLTTKHAEAGKKIGDLEGRLKDALFIPGDKATDEERAAFYTKLGRPEKADAYDLKIEGVEMPQGMTVKPEHEAWFRGLAHKLGLNPSQAKTVFTEGIKNLFVEPLKAMLAEKTKLQEAGMTTFKTEWGAAFDENLTLIDRALKQFGTPELTKFLDMTGKGNDPAIVNFVLKVGKAMADDKFVTGGAAGDKRKPGQLVYPSMQT